MNEMQLFANDHGRINWYDENGTIFLNLDQCARGLGFVQYKNGIEYVRWETVKSLIDSFGYSQQVGNFPFAVGKESYILENIFYRLAMKAKNETAERFQAWIADEVIPSIRKTGSYSRAMSPAEQLVAQAQMLLVQEKRLCEIETRVASIEARNTTHPEDYVSVAGYARLKGISLSLPMAQAYGKKAALLSKERGIKTSRVHDERFGSVGAYRLDILDEIFEEDAS